MKKVLSLLLVLFFFFFFCPADSYAESKIKDSESASHSDEAARYAIVDTYEFPGFRIVQFDLAVLSHYSYILTSSSEALIVDPGRDIDAYVEYVKKEKLTVKGIYLTHSHADFVAGHLEAAKEFGCPVYINQAAGAGYKHEPVKEGSEIAIGEAVVKVIETPGHTPDGTCGLVYSRGAAGAVRAIFSGDTLFIGGVGRPDLVGGAGYASSKLASMMYDSWWNKLSKLNDDAAVFPAHGAGSLCGTKLGDDPSSTIGRERASNPYLQPMSRADFITKDLEGLGDPPKYFFYNAKMNKEGPELVDWKAPFPQEVKAEEALADFSKNYVVDLRSAEEYAQGHIPNSINIGLRGRLETWTGIMVPVEANLVLAGSRAELEEALRRLHRIGYKAGVIIYDSWKKSGLSESKNIMITAAELYSKMTKGEAPIIIDVRLPNEWMGLRIGNVVNLPINTLYESSVSIDTNEAVVAVCNSAFRSSLAVGLLERRGFSKAASMKGGSEAWIEAGYPVYGNQNAQGQAASEPRKNVKIADRISAAELKRLLMDLPGTFDLVDIRPAEHFNDYSIQGSKNVDFSILINDQSFLTGAGPLIIVDRDGSLAMMAGGILSQKTERRIKVLYGGLDAYWNESASHSATADRGGAGSQTAKPAFGPSGTTIQPAPSTAPAPSAPGNDNSKPGSSKPAKKKSAGC